MLCCAGVQELTQDTFKAPRGVRVRGYGHMFQDSTAHSTRLRLTKTAAAVRMAVFVVKTVTLLTGCVPDSSSNGSDTVGVWCRCTA